MSTLILVRHGQASFLSDDYDRLSTLGERQAQLLGEYWAGQGLGCDRVLTGPRLRQQRTAELVVEACRKQGLTWPDPELMSELDEHQGHELLEQCLPQLMGRDDGIRLLEEAFCRAQTLSDKARSYQKLLEVVLSRWVRGELNGHAAESWDAFTRRVLQGLERITRNHGGGQRVVAFTSGGPTGVAVQRALQTTAEATLNLTWMVRNAALTEFLFTQDRFTLSSFNAIPHLSDATHWTYR